MQVTKSNKFHSYTDELPSTQVELHWVAKQLKTSVNWSPTQVENLHQLKESIRPRNLKILPISYFPINCAHLGVSTSRVPAATCSHAAGYFGESFGLHIHSLNLTNPICSHSLKFIKSLGVLKYNVQ